MTEIPKQLTAEEIERNKDKLDLKPNIDFVSRNKDRFEHGIAQLVARQTDPEAVDWASSIAMEGTDAIVDPQVTPEGARTLLAKMPEGLREISKLKNVNYVTFGKFRRMIPVPGYDEEGNFDSSKVEMVSVDDFPRPQDHPSRILVGVSNGLNIFPTPIPKSVSEDAQAVKLYQIHVFLHEFFHTIDYPRRDPSLRAEILLETDGRQFTLQDWWKEFEDLILSGKEPGCVSSYAATYTHQLNKETAAKDCKKFTHALAEQICESFVAYQLGIIANDEGWTDFREESFGNEEQYNRFLQGKVPSANKKWELMDRLCRARVLNKDYKGL